jgi:hypothetical protein
MAKAQEKRSFGMDTTSLATEVPMLDAGVYAGEVTNAAVSSKEGNSFFEITRIRGKWEADKPKEGGIGDWEFPGGYTIEGFINYGVVLLSKKAIKILQRDEPKIFGGRINLTFDSETLQLGKESNTTLANFLVALDLHQTNFAELVDWEYDDNAEIPEFLQGEANALDLANALAYHKAYFANIVQAANNVKVKVRIAKFPKRSNPAEQENTIYTGDLNKKGYSSMTFCGILPYEEGSENDLEI